MNKNDLTVEHFSTVPEFLYAIEEFCNTQEIPYPQIKGTAVWFFTKGYLAAVEYNQKQKMKTWTISQCDVKNV